MQGLEEFREHLGRKLTITLIEGIGKQKDVLTINKDKMILAIESLLADSSQPIYYL